MTKNETLRLALEALEMYELETNSEFQRKAITAIKAALEAKDEPMAHSVVAGALFDFMGWLTSREKRLILSSVDEASPAVEAITEFAKKRNLSLKYAEVGYWMEFLSTPPQLEAKDEPVEQPKVRTGDCLLVGVCASEGHKIQPQRTWVGLTDEEILEIFGHIGTSNSDINVYVLLNDARKIEAKLKEKNT